jgi:hypothetical protein
MEQSEILNHSVRILSVSRNGKSSDFRSEKNTQNMEFVPNHTVEDKKICEFRSKPPNRRDERNFDGNPSSASGGLYRK